MANNIKIVLDTEAIEQRLKELQALELWREFLAGDTNPSYADGSGDNLCFFCGSWLDIGGNPHEPDCIYIRAKALVEGSADWQRFKEEIRPSVEDFADGFSR